MTRSMDVQTFDTTTEAARLDGADTRAAHDAPAARDARTLPVTDRTRLRRMPKRGSYDAQVVHAILDEAMVCHLGFAMRRGTGEGAPVGGAAPIVLPTFHARIDDTLYVHGSSASHMLRSLAKGLEVCVTVTLIDGLVFARSAFHHSMNYRSVVVFGTATLVEDDGEKRRALDVLVDKLSPGRSKACRGPNEKELLATKVIAVPIVEASAKIRTGPPLDDAEDMALPYWAGVVPVQLARGLPRTAGDCDVGPPLDLR